MVVKQALGGVQDVLFLQPEVSLQVSQQVFEVGVVRFIGADVLRRVDRVEFNTQLAIRGARSGP